MILDGLDIDELKVVKNFISKAQRSILYVGVPTIAFTLKNDLNPLTFSSIFAGTFLYTVFKKSLLNKEIEDYESVINSSMLDVYYYEILSRIIDLSKKLHYDSINDLFGFLSLIIYGNYLRYDDDNDTHYDKLLSNRISSSIVLNNHGVCRHKSSFLYDVLYARGYKCYMLLGTDADMDYSYYKSSDDYKVEFLSPRPNHCILYACDDKNEYYLDLSKLTSYTNSRYDKYTLVSPKGLAFLIDIDRTNAYNHCDVDDVIGSKEASLTNYDSHVSTYKFMSNISSFTKFYDGIFDYLKKSEEEYKKLILVSDIYK